MDDFCHIRIRLRFHDIFFIGFDSSFVLTSNGIYRFESVCTSTESFLPCSGRVAILWIYFCRVMVEIWIDFKWNFQFRIRLHVDGNNFFELGSGYISREFNFWVRFVLLVDGNYFVLYGSGCG